MRHPLRIVLALASNQCTAAIYHCFQTMILDSSDLKNVVHLEKHSNIPRRIVQVNDVTVGFSIIIGLGQVSTSTQLITPLPGGESRLTTVQGDCGGAIGDTRSKYALYCRKFSFFFRTGLWNLDCKRRRALIHRWKEILSVVVESVTVVLTGRSQILWKT